ncbi:hypothetical protein NH340_JMT00405 [Sarcoptes scabiei]|nr:hypothetical protein NH340_JMT00405 [Sarcoptes scabiei]
MNDEDLARLEAKKSSTLINEIEHLAVIVKYLKNVHPGQLAVSRFCGIFILTIPMIIYYDLDPFGPSELRPLLILRGFAGATSLFLRFVAFHYLPIADASVIIFSMPIFVSIFAWFYLKEPCGLFHTFTVMIAMLGLLMTTKMPMIFTSGAFFLPSTTYLGYQYHHQQMHHFHNQHHHNHYHHQFQHSPALNSLHRNQQNNELRMNSILMNHSSPSSLILQRNLDEQQDQRLYHFYGVITALSSLIFSSLVFIFIRKARDAHHAVIMFNFGWVAILETTIITFVLDGFSMPRNRFEWYLIVVLSVFAFCGQILLTRSLQLEQAGPVSVVRATTDIALAFLWQLIIFKEMPDIWSICGALIVSSCIVLTAMRKWVISLSDHSRLKTKLSFLLM